MPSNGCEQMLETEVGQEIARIQHSRMEVS